MGTAKAWTLTSLEPAPPTEPFGRESPPVVRPSHAEAQSGSRADVATVSFIGAGVLLGAGLLTYLLEPGEERAKPRLEVRPAVIRNGVAVWARTVF